MEWKSELLKLWLPEKTMSAKLAESEELEVLWARRTMGW
jgi:hypothetical protein